MGHPPCPKRVHDLAAFSHHGVFEPLRWANCPHFTPTMAQCRSDTPIGYPYRPSRPCRSPGLPPFVDLRAISGRTPIAGPPPRGPFPAGIVDAPSVQHLSIGG